jgi:hypothetical protein
VIDPLGRLVGFESRVRVADLEDAIKVSGQVEGSTLSITVRSGDIPTTVERYLPPNALMTDELSPQAVVPGLRLGQRWTVPLYSPFRPPTNPIEILHAEVERGTSITWNGRQYSGKMIVFRGDPGAGPSSDDVRGRTWVRDDGLVVRQEIRVLRSNLLFTRLSREQAEEVTASLGEELSADLPRALQAGSLPEFEGVTP